MSVKSIKAQINGTWVTLTKNETTGKYEGTIAAPNITSFNRAGGYYPVTIQAEDLAGNITAVDDSHATLGDKCKLYVKEVTKPTITFTAPAAGAYLASNTPAISFQLRDETNGSGIKISTLVIKIDGGTSITNTSWGSVVTSVSDGYNVTYTPQSALPDGSHTVTVNIQDNDGNAATQASRSFTVDTVPPILSVTSPAEGITYKNAATLAISGTTNDSTSSPVTIAIKLNSANQETVTVDGNGNFSKTVTLVEGSNTIEITATDKAGKTTTVTRTVILDTTAPVVNSITIVPNPVNVGQSYVITIEAIDD